MKLTKVKEQNVQGRLQLFAIITMTTMKNKGNQLETKKNIQLKEMNRCTNANVCDELIHFGINRKQLFSITISINVCSC